MNTKKKYKNPGGRCLKQYRFYIMWNLMGISIFFVDRLTKSLTQMLLSI